MIAILGAMQCEIEELLAHTSNQREIIWGPNAFYLAILHGQEVLIVRSGVGKAMAAMMTQRLIDEYSPRAILVTGIAGALRPELEIGDMVIARDTLQHDFDATALGFARGEIPYTTYRIFTSDKKLHDHALTTPLESGKVISGRILTGDQFITAGEKTAHRYLREELQGDAIEMEGAAIGFVASVNAVPFVIARTISDKADGSAVGDFTSFLPRASKNSLAVVRHILSQGY